MKKTAFLLVALLVLFTNVTAHAQPNKNLERNIWPEIEQYLSEKNNTNPAGTSVLIARVLTWNLSPKSASQTSIVISSNTLTQWKHGRYGVAGLTHAEIEICRRSNKIRSPIDALLPDIKAQLDCYGNVVSLCMGTWIPVWNVVSDYLGGDPKKLGDWAVQFVNSHTACKKCPCQPPLPPGLIWTPPGVQAEIVCIGKGC